VLTTEFTGGLLRYGTGPCEACNGTGKCQACGGSEVNQPAKDEQKSPTSDFAEDVAQWKDCRIIVQVGRSLPRDIGFDFISGGFHDFRLRVEEQVWVVIRPGTNESFCNPLVGLARETITEMLGKTPGFFPPGAVSGYIIGWVDNSKGDIDVLQVCKRLTARVEEFIRRSDEY